MRLPDSVASFLVGLAAPIMFGATMAEAGTGPLDPRGRIHIPIGMANTLDTLKTFVEAEGCFSPGVGSYGVYFWVYDHRAAKLIAPTMDGVKCERGLDGAGYLIPWTSWEAAGVRVRTEVCEVRRGSPAGEVLVVGARVRLSYPPAGAEARGREEGAGAEARGRVSLYVALRPLGPAGWAVRELAVSDDGDALLVDGHPAIVANEKPNAAGVLATDTIGQVATAGKMPAETRAASPAGDCSGALRFELALAPGESKTLGFVCPVLPGRRAVGHQWDGRNPWAQLDDAKLNPAEGGLLQPDPGLAYYRGLKADGATVGLPDRASPSKSTAGQASRGTGEGLVPRSARPTVPPGQGKPGTAGQASRGTSPSLFEEATAYWRDLVGRATVKTPDPRWGEAFAAIVGHVALAMNEGAPDVAVVNYNVFNRDGVYVANILQKAGRFDLAEAGIDYFLSHPFNGRVAVEADNPGQVLWAMGQHWLLSRDAKWLGRVYPAAAKIAAMIRYCRTTPPPHYVRATSLDFGDALPPDQPGDPPAHQRQVLKPGSCDGHHPEYTEAFDIAGLRAAALLAKAAGKDAEAAEWAKLASSLFDQYDARFGAKLPSGYGSYSVLWPCRLFPIADGKAYEQFRRLGAQKPSGWRYFPLAAAHQGLLAGNREAGHGTLSAHFDHEQMRGWYAFDEGGHSGAGGWRHVRTTWNSAVAMPHGWAIAELWLLLRDSLLFEDGDRLVLLGGVPPGWLTGGPGITIENLPSYFGSCSFSYAPQGKAAALRLTGSAAPPGGFLLRLPATLKASVTVDEKPAAQTANGDLILPPGAKEARIEFLE